MSIGRISGQLLKSNLQRDGADLAFETDLLYLDVNNSRIGLKTDSPSYELDVAGTINSTSLISGEVNVDNVNINGSSLSTVVGDINVSPATETDKINLNGDVEVTGSIYATGNITVDGDITLGDANTDSIIFNAEINSNIIPNSGNTYDLGSALKKWKVVYTEEIDSISLTLGGQIITEFSIDQLLDGVNDAQNNLGLGFGTYIDDEFEGLNNVAVGNNSQSAVTTGTNNTTLGDSAGSTITQGSNNIVIGSNAQPTAATVSNEITIGNAQSNKFRLPGVTFFIDNGDVLIGTEENLLSKKLQVSGSANVTGTVTATVLQGTMDGGFY